MQTVNSIIRAITTLASIAFVSGCSVSSSSYAVQPSVNPTSIVQINQYFEIPSQKARVYIQNGVAIMKRNIDKLSTYCSVLMQDLHKAGEPKLTVSPGQFEIIKIRKFNDYSSFPGTFVASRKWIYDFPVVVIFEVEMRLKSAEQPGIRSLFCAKQVQVFSPFNSKRHYPSLTEIRTALVDAIEIKMPQ